jgi:hypothetical protein
LARPTPLHIIPKSRLQQRKRAHGVSAGRELLLGLEGVSPVLRARGSDGSGTICCQRAAGGERAGSARKQRRLLARARTNAFSRVRPYTRFPMPMPTRPHETTKVDANVRPNIELI